jgi:hypothetical protein
MSAFFNMEKKQSKNTIMKLLPKASSIVVGFQNAPFSPGRDKAKLHHHHSKGFFSGPLVNVPDESRRKKKKKKPSNNNLFESDDHQEPTSPKISCIGQIKHKKEKIKSKCPKNNNNNQKTTSLKPQPVEKQSSFKLKSFLKSRRSRSDADNNINVKDEIPSLSQMKRFASSRDTFANFDWMPQISLEDYCDEDRMDEVFIPFSAPILRTDHGDNYERIKGLQPKKEINLWKRRTLDQPRPLQLN